MTLPKTVQLSKLLPRLSSSEHYELRNMIDAAIDLKTPNMPNLEPFRQALPTMAHKDIIALGRERALLEKSQREAQEKERVDAERFEAAASSGAEGVWTLRQEKVLCGKANCAKLHGPYWYGYRTVGQKTKKKYFGKKKPSESTLEAIEKEMLADERAKLEAAAKKKAVKRGKS